MNEESHPKNESVNPNLPMDEKRMRLANGQETKTPITKNPLRINALDWYNSQNPVSRASIAEGIIGPKTVELIGADKRANLKRKATTAVAGSSGVNLASEILAGGRTKTERKEMLGNILPIPETLETVPRGRFEPKPVEQGVKEKGEIYEVKAGDSLEAILRG